MTILNHSTYTILVPDNPSEMAVYCHSNSALPHSNGRKGKTKYNFQEEIADQLSEDLPNAIVAVSTYDIKPIKPVITKLSAYYGIQSKAVGGWSLGGNNALKLAAELDADVILMDCNHTNQVKDTVFDKIQGNKCIYISNNLNGVKLAKLSKAYTYFYFDYHVISIPADVKVSNHRYCRDYALENGIYKSLLSNTSNALDALDDDEKACSGLISED